MRLPIVIAAALAFVSVAPDPAQAQPILLKLGESVTLTVDDGGKAIEIRREPAPPLTPFETVWARDVTGGTLDWAVGPNVAYAAADDEHFPPPGPIPPAAVAAKLVRIGERNILLVITNGYPRGFKYRAKLRRADRATTTDVCEVMAGKHGFEHWPYLFDAIEISDVRLIPWQEGQAPVCE